MDECIYYTFGMEMPGRRWRALNEDAAQFGFNGKENDNEVKGEGVSLETYHRHLDSRLGRWLSSDPLENVFPGRSPYLYASNSPISRVDIYGDTDYWSQSGKLVGTDGVANGRILILVSEDDVDKASSNHYGTGFTGFWNRLVGNGGQGVTSISEFAGDIVEVPSLQVRQAILTAVDRSNAPSSDDQKGGFHEEGGYWGIDRRSGNIAAVPAVAGAYSDPRIVSQATINVFNASDPSLGLSVEVSLGDYHVHPKGSVGILGGRVADFVQPPSQGDVLGVSQQSTPGYLGIVVGALTKDVFFFGSETENLPSKTYRAKIPLNALKEMTPNVAPSATPTPTASPKR